jgi:hypothetical protein
MHFWDTPQLCDNGIFFAASGFNSGEGHNDDGEDDQPVMEFTGLFDKTGKEVYEGDIIEGSLFFKGGTLPTMGEVRWYDEYAAFCVENEGGKTLLHNHDIGSFVVRGNIYQNPEIKTDAKSSANSACNKPEAGSSGPEKI